MMESAERDEIAEPGLAAVGPVLHVVTFREARPRATREAATAVAAAQCAHECRRNRARAATYVQRLALRRLRDTDERRVAREPARRVERERRTVVELAAVRLALVGLSRLR